MFQFNDIAAEFLVTHYFVDTSLVDSKFIITASKNEALFELVLDKLNELLQENPAEKVLFDSILI